MTDALHDREKSEEAKYKLDEERHFKVLCRRNKLFGLWAAEKLGLPDGERQAYAKGLVMMLLEDNDPDGALDRVRTDCRDATAALTAWEIEDAFANCFTRADEALRGEWHALDGDHEPVGG